MPHGRTLVCAAGLGGLLSAASAAAGEGCVRSAAPPPDVAAPIELRLEDVAPGTARGAIALWQGCRGAGASAPAFVLTAGGAGRVLTRRLAAHGRAVCGELRGNEILLYAFAGGAGGVRRCGNQAETLAHELGHLLGLDDAPADAACAGHIMAPNPGPGGVARAVRRGECLAVGARRPARPQQWAAWGVRVALL